MNFCPSRVPLPQPSPRSFGLAALLVPLAACAFMLLSAWLAYPAWERAFRSDASPVSWLSSALLLTLSVLSVRLLADGGLPRWLGIWLTLSMLVLALDEQFMLHELWKYRCHELSAWCEIAWVRELPMRMVGLTGAITVALMLRALPRRLTRGLLLAGITCGLWAIAVDQWPMPYPIAELEEAFEVLAESLVLAALLSVPTPAPGAQVQS
ncbi:hypothetical protein [Paucibacter sp. KCTC 42545]|uniref:hypothetical protein n=1 Tax=Paucibacter sp. KCTC 42545 TaxID=1768242 RepID=UPI000733AE1B|nr:hypothetical protein [Paucibacter sp. KCTC 42545]ALT79999.1 hypothetical protein AT984_18270 [Paucibacter sp. KCTC 42545]